MPEKNEKIYFSSDLTDRERACFETGIKLGALYHILCGIPISTNENIITNIKSITDSVTINFVVLFNFNGLTGLLDMDSPPFYC